MMSTYLKRAQELQKWIAEGKSLEALDEFYDDDVHVFEMANGTHRKGKIEQREAILEWFDMIKETHGGGYKSICSDEKNKVTTAESWVEITLKDGTRMKMEEVAVQKWENEKIVEEKFYHNFG